jgi:uncharacterized membrane protein YuzA (DUF378 family)
MAVTHTYESESRTGTRGTAVRRFNPMDWIAMILLIVGGLNWGLVGLADFDLVAALFGEGSGLSRVVYVLVGLAALYSIYTTTKMGRRTGDAV